jgi:hypothetical protein
VRDALREPLRQPNAAEKLNRPKVQEPLAIGESAPFDQEAT